MPSKCRAPKFEILPTSLQFPVRLRADSTVFYPEAGFSYFHEEKSANSSLQAGYSLQAKTQISQTAASKDKSGVGIIVDYSRDYTVVNCV